MKPIAAAAAGALLAAGVMYIVMRPDRPADPPAQAIVTAQPAPTAPAAETPVPTAVEAPPPPPPPRVAPKRAPVRSIKSTPTTVAQSTIPPQAPAQQPLQQPPQQPAQQTTSNSDLVWNPAPPPPNADSKIPAVEDKKPERVPQTVTIPAGTLLSVRLDQSLSTKSAQTGDSFKATLDQPLVVDSLVIAERGSRIEGRVVEADPGGRVQGLAKLTLELVRLDSSDGQRLRLQTEPFAKQAQSETKRDVAKVGAAAGIGAAIGAIAGGGKGAAIGAAIGGATGAGGVAATRGGAAEVPAETRMTFRLRDPITVTEKL
jgi:hypothetical protein